MPRYQPIEHQLTVFTAILEECDGLKSRVENERDALAAITAALVQAGEVLVQRGLVPREQAEGIASSVEENACDLQATLDDVDASIEAAIRPVEAFAEATRRIGAARALALCASAGEPALAPGTQAAAEIDRMESVATQHSLLCERLLARYRELADTASVTLDDLRHKVERLQVAFSEIMAAMSTSYSGMWH